MAKNQKADSAKQQDNIDENRSQIFNPLTGNYIKREGSTGKLTEIKSNGKPFSGIRVEEKKTYTGGITISKSVAEKAEQAVIKTHNRKAELNAR